MIQPAILELGKLGRLASGTSDDDVAKISQQQKFLDQVSRPVSDDDARALLKLFGVDDSFGGAWTLVHLIETAPGWPLWEALAEIDCEWSEVLRKRACNAGPSNPT